MPRVLSLLTVLAMASFAAPALAGPRLPPIYGLVTGDDQEPQNGAATAPVAARTGTKVAAKPKARPRHIVPTLLTDGLVVDITDRRLYWFENGDVKAEFPVAVGRNAKWPTPQGSFYIIERRKDPEWRVPLSIQAEMRAAGKPVQTRVPPGPKNPLGKYFIALSSGGVGFHGTNAPSSVGRYATHGCMRMHAEDVARLYHETQNGMHVDIVYDPVSLAVDQDGRIWLEVHDDVYRGSKADLGLVRQALTIANLARWVDWDRAADVIKRRSGNAEEITLTPVPPGHPSAPPAEEPVMPGGGVVPAALHQP
jgi:L,D-transpeptidase ErfK/SrfK